ncbi:MAG: cupin domain-containing protein [Dehalococcoidia bacterium]|nr:cupin domain-containing protein [Dehalococcoidia bacterium]
MQFRRVVTGHDAGGNAIVKSDEVVGTTPLREGVNAKVMWTTEGFPVDNSGDADESLRVTGTFHPNGTVFRLVEFLPGAQPRNHRTDSIDYGVVVSGQMHMELDQETVVLNAGDVVVQRGTIHNWVNKGPAPCVMAFILIDAKPVDVGGKVLHAAG